jgi:hypothetical protein
MNPQTFEALLLVLELLEQLSGPEDEWSHFDDLLFRLSESLQKGEK